jgi:hypothetical protein
VKIGILGAGHIGATLAELCADAGHDVSIANSRDPATLAQFVAGFDGPPGSVRAASAADAVRTADLIVLAMPWPARAALPDPTLFTGKIVIDATNPYAADGTTALDVEPTTSTETVAALLPEARLVKAFNTMWWKNLRDQRRPPGDPTRLALLAAGDDPEAKTIVMRLIEQVGFDPVDTGGLADGGRRQQPSSPAYAVPLSADKARQVLEL